MTWNRLLKAVNSPNDKQVLMKRFAILFLSVVFQVLPVSAQVKVLFDARKAQMAGNADWVIDADLYNIGTGSGGAMQAGRGNEANPQRYPTPAQSGITASTPENYWKGGLSAWGVELAKRGYLIETLPFNGTISYGSSSNPQDLSNYKVFICVEPNIRFTTAEKQAIIRFVQNGGGLFMGGNHYGSDRNNDSWDAPRIWNDLMTNNGLINNPFGISFDQLSFSQTTSNFASLPGNPILSGAAGSPTQMKFSSGTSMTLNKTANPTSTGLVYRTGLSTTGNSGVMFAQCRYGTGKVATIGDSSPPDDGTGDTNDQLYNGWSAEVNGDHSRILLNATIWLASSTLRESSSSYLHGAQVWPNPSSGMVQVEYQTPSESILSVQLIDLTGKSVLTRSESLASGLNRFELSLEDLNPGLYILVLNDGKEQEVIRLVRQ